MNILVIGANGKAGHRIVEKALKAGHQVTGVVRREGAIEGIPTIVKDALQLKKQELTQFDVVVNATSAFTNHTIQLNDTPDFPKEFLVRSKTHGKSDDILRKFSNVDWTMFTPPPILDAEGPESNDYVLGNENVILNKEGKPYISYATFAQILVDEINNHKFGRQRFTAVQN